MTPRKCIIGNDEVYLPRLTIWAGCGDNDKLIHQMKNLRYREWKGNVTDKDAPEQPEQKERHLVDALIYILLDEPRFISRRPVKSTFEPIYPAIGY